MTFTPHEKFVIHEPTWQRIDNILLVTSTYSCDKLSFHETCEFVIPSRRMVEVAPADLVALIKLVSIASAPSYYKATLAQTIAVDFAITSEVQNWAQGLFDEGLREFRFHNDLDFSNVPVWDVETTKSMSVAPSASSKLCLVPIGGGKDSITSLEIIAQSDCEAVGFAIGDFPAIESTAKAAKVHVVRVKRKLDPILFELNEQGAPNGHVPVTALTSVLACLGAACIGADSVVMSNESSADEPTRVVSGVEVNHQWSKSFAAEKLLRNAVSSLGLPVNYFSLLRSMSEYEIFALFSTFEKYHHGFTSCNHAFRIDESKRSQAWCADCDKCRFVFLGLAGFSGVDYATAIFGVDMFDDTSQVQGFLDLVGDGDKPFECVGTTHESRMMARNSLLWDVAAASVVGKALAEVLSNVDVMEEKFAVTHQDFVPDELKATILNMQVQQYGEQLRGHFEHETIAVMGLGRDTAGIIRFLDACNATQSIDVFLPESEELSPVAFRTLLDRAGLDRVSVGLKCVHDFSHLTASIVFVSPGISRYSEQVQSLGERATTPLAWWLEHNKIHFPNKCFIGVTGTKGKSTTSSMIAHVLDNSQLAGNVGKAVGDIDIKELISDDYIVLEVSSFQASYVTTSPDVVALTSLFDCHIDWHRTSENYRNDKSNLFIHGPSVVVMPTELSGALRIYDKSLANTPAGIHTLNLEGKTLNERNESMVREVVKIVAPTMTDELVSERLQSFEPLKYRQEVVAVKNGVTFISDVLSTAPRAVINSVEDVALTYQKAKIHLLVGGADRHVDQSELVESLNKNSECVVVITLPETGHSIESQLKSFVHADELADGVAFAGEQAQDGDVVLLAPGGPSFHRYDNYEHLAAHFVELIDKI